MNNFQYIYNNISHTAVHNFDQSSLGPFNLMQISNSHPCAKKRQEKCDVIYANLN